ncbi:MAG: PP-loop family protein [Deltaproteobacteria bacterium]|jgi:uncharacterized protein|nr:PP-loop family protein [Deltaproteobacteria bacterium]
MDHLWARLRERLLALDAESRASGGRGLAIAFSGGVDSRFLTHAAALLNIEVLALHFCGPHFKREAEAAALDWLRGRTGEHSTLSYSLIEADALALDEVRHNSPERCYHCKKLAFGLLRAEALRRGKSCLCDGSLASDNQEYRPGRRAMTELGIVSPLADVGFTKAEVRELGAKLGLDDTAQQGQPCLLTRFDYGLEATPDLLHVLDRAESAVTEVLREFSLCGAAPFNGELPFRLRLLTSKTVLFQPELHLQLAPESLAAQPELRDNLIHALASHEFTAHGLGQVKIVAMPDLSGFFDRRG